jgi:tetratricopeptide (TPR) repeat protein
MRGLVVGILCCFAVSGYARTSGDSAKAHYEAGEAYYSSTDYASALKEFTASYGLEPRSALLYDIARCHEGLGNLEMAVNYFESYLNANSAVPDRMNIEQHIANLKDRIQPEQKVEPKPVPPPVVVVQPAPPAPVRRHKSYKLAWALGGTGLVLTLAGVGTGAYSLATYNSLAGSCKNFICSPSYSDKRDSGAAAGLATDILLPVGIGVMGAGLITFIVEKTKR